MPFDYTVLTALDTWWLAAINKLGAISIISLFARTLGAIGSGWIWIAIAVLLLTFKGRKWLKWCALLLAALLITGYVADVLKVIVARPRPYLVLSDVVRFASAEPSFAFPSGHASRAFASAAVLVAGAKRWWWAWLALASAVGISRVILGLHYPSDVVGGALLGYAIGWVLVRLMQFLQDRRGAFNFKRKLEKSESH